MFRSTKEEIEERKEREAVEAREAVEETRRQVQLAIEATKAPEPDLGEPLSGVQDSDLYQDAGGNIERRSDSPASSSSFSEATSGSNERRLDRVAALPFLRPDNDEEMVD